MSSNCPQPHVPPPKMARTPLMFALVLALVAVLLYSFPNMRRAAYLGAAMVGRTYPPLAPFFPVFFGDGREAAAADYVLSHAPPHNLTAALAAFEAYADSVAWMMAVGPVKGAIITEALQSTPAYKILELGTYCGYGAMLLASASPPGARIYTVEVVPEFAAVARRILVHAGLAKTVSVLEGPLETHLPSLAAAAPEGPFDFVFVDHDKDAYLPDVKALLATPGLVRGGESGGTVLGVDNLGLPGSPAMVAWLRSRRPGALDTAWHKTVVEFVRGIPDLVSVSRVLDAAAALSEK